MKQIGFAFLVIAALTSGCSIGTEPDYEETPPSASTSVSQGEHSSSLDTNQMSASMSAQSDGTTLKIYAAVFDVASDEPVTLDEGDFFTASTGAGDPLVLVLESSQDDSYLVHYSASLPAAASAQDVTISLVRKNGVSAPNSVLHVPAPFTVAPTVGGPVAFGDPIDVHAAPAFSGDIQVQATGVCLESDEDSYNPNTFDDAIDFDANGNGQFSTAQLLVGENIGGQGCDITFYVSAISDGVLDSNFAGGATGVHDAEGMQTSTFDKVITEN